MVWVKDIDTVFYETSCGSGSLSTAIFNYLRTGKKNIDIIQPSNKYINVQLVIDGEYIKSVKVTGKVENI